MGARSEVFFVFRSLSLLPRVRPLRQRVAFPGIALDWEMIADERERVPPPRCHETIYGYAEHRVGVVCIAIWGSTNRSE